jgi:GDP-L-fucose synthase
MQEIKNKRIIITAPNSMIGRSISREVKRLGGYVYELPHENFDLLDFKVTKKAFLDIRADYVFNLASYNGNIKFNSIYPCDIFYRTTQIGMNVLTASVQSGVKRICSLISSCAYPPELPLIEENFFKGKPHDSVEGHGFAKKILVEYGRQIKKQHNIDCINICVNHVYGPYDSFNPEKTKVVGSLINKFSDAKKNNDKFVELWGSGESYREFIYVDDVGKYIPFAFERYNDSFEILNIASGKEVSIKDLANIIKESVGFNGEIIWNGQNDGQKSKLLNNSKMKTLFGELEFLNLNEGIERTVDWYAKHNSSNN